MKEFPQQLLQEFFNFAIHLKAIVREQHREVMREKLDVLKKADNSFVTSLDTQLEKILRNKILKRYPDHGVIGEEFGETNAEADFVWTLDPIDGTEELVYGIPLYGSIISLLYQGSPILGLIDHPALDICTVGAIGMGVFRNNIKLNALPEVNQVPRLYLGSRHQFLRGQDDSEIFSVVSKQHPNLRVFCTCYGFTSLINGEADIALEYNLKIWDLAAVEVLIREVGGGFVKIGERNSASSPRLYGAVFGKKALIDEVLILIDEKRA